MTHGRKNGAETSKDAGPGQVAETRAPEPVSTEAIGAATQGVSHALATPITLGEQPITDLHVRRPKPGDLRGLQLGALVNGDTDAMLKLIPRLTTPALPEEIICEQMNALDLIGLTDKVVQYLTVK